MRTLRRNEKIDVHSDAEEMISFYSPDGMTEIKYKNFE